MSYAKVLKRSALIAAAVALTASGLLIVPAQAAPACEKWGWPGGIFTIRAGNGTTTNMSTSQDRVVGRPFFIEDGAPSSDATYGNPSGGFTGSDIDITINWDQGKYPGYTWHYVGKINDQGLASGVLHATNRDDNWSSDNKFTCTAYKPAEQAPPPPAAATSVQIKSGPATLQAGLSGTYVITVANISTDAKPIRVFIIFAGKLEQTGQINAQGGLDCVVGHDAGINASVSCTGPIPQGSYDIVVQGRGSAPGAGQLVAKLDNDTKQQNVTIT